MVKPTVLVSHWERVEAREKREQLPSESSADFSQVNCKLKTSTNTYVYGMMSESKLMATFLVIHPLIFG